MASSKVKNYQEKFIDEVICISISEPTLQNEHNFLNIGQFLLNSINW